MGRKDKHKAGQSRNHPVFKVMGNSGKVGNKGNNQKASEVKSKLKKVNKKRFAFIGSILDTPRNAQGVSELKPIVRVNPRGLSKSHIFSDN